MLYQRRILLALLLLTGAAVCRRAQSLVPVSAGTPNTTLAVAGEPGLLARHPLKFAHLSVAQGLSQFTVLCALQDRQGFMWFGTQDGLNRYDGYEFRVYRHAETQPGSIRDNYILSLFEDRAGTLWVGTNKGGLNRYDAQTEQFTAYVNNPNDPESLSLNTVTAMVEDQAGYLWVATDGQGVNRFDRQTGKFKRFVNDPALYENRRANIVNTLLLDRGGTLWLGTSWGLHEFDLRTQQVVRRFTHDPNNPQSLSFHRVQTIYEDTTGIFWVGTAAGFNRLERATGRITRYVHAPTLAENSPEDDVKVVYQDRHGLLWLATLGGLAQFDIATGRFTREVATPQNPTGLSGNRLFVLYEDRVGSFWIAAQEAGLNRYDAQAKPFFNFELPLIGPPGLEPRKVFDFFEDQAGQLWLGTSDGLMQFDLATGQFRPVPLVLSDQPLATKISVRRLWADRAGQRWLFTPTSLYRLTWEPNGRVLARLVFTPENVGSIRTVWVTQDDQIWLGTHRGGLQRLNPVTGAVTAFVNVPQDESSLSNNLVFAIREDRAGQLWIGTTQGLNRLDRRTGKFTRFLNDSQNPASLSYNLIWSIFEDRAGRLWIGTGDGLNLFDPGTQSFRRFMEKDGLANGNVNGIMEDARGQLWLCTWKGLTRFDPATQAARNYDVTDGLFGDRANAYFQNQAGAMFVGGTKAFSVFRPEQLQSESAPPPIVLTSCQRYNTGIVEGSALIEPGITARSAIEFSYKDNILTFEFAALSFRHPEKNRYAYQLAGYSDRWIELGNKRDVTFTNLDAGAYTLRVRGANADGIWNMTGTSLRIRIIPPFWQRWWFVSLELLTLVGLVWGAYRLRITALQRRSAQQEAFARQLIESQEAERKRLAAELHDSLGQHLLVIKNRALLGEQTTAEQTPAREQFDEIVASASQAISEVRTISHNLRPLNLERLGLTAVIEEMVERIAQVAGLQFSTDLDPLDGLLSKDAEINLFRVLQESLNNILKHAQATKAYLEIWREGELLRVTVRDNGCGYVPLNSAARGLGLTSIGERVRLLGGTHTVTTAPGAGTMLEIKIPLAVVGEKEPLTDAR